MNQKLEALLKVQVVDKTIFEMSKTLQEIPLALTEYDKKVSEQKNHLAAAEQRSKEVVMSLHKKELALKEKEASILKYEGQLAQVKTNKEYAALKTEIANIKADNSLLEEEIIKLLDEVQSAEKIVKEEKDVFQRCEAERQVKKKELESQQKTVEAEMKKVQDERAELAKQVDQESFQLYDRIVKAKHGVALAPIAGESCGICQMKLLSQTINEVMLGDRLVTCENCCRILYLSS